MGSKLWLVLLGVGLGLLARITLGGPEQTEKVERKFKQPIPPEYLEAEPNSDSIDIPIERQPEEESHGLVPPLQIQPGYEPVSLETGHSHRAEFEPHGEEICASGCALSRHPTPNLSRAKFLELVENVTSGAMNESNTALEELVYFGSQTQSHLNYVKTDLKQEWIEYLSQELTKTHARIEIRVVDEFGEVRSWLPPTRVPLDRRHVFKMETNGVQPLTTSGTVKRVGLNHMWARL